MKQLEEIVEGLEQGDVALEKAIDLYKKGISLSKTCHDKLVSIEEQLDQIMTEDGEILELNVQKEEQE
ncbi:MULTISPECIES: exodeoxyribonuclease VII small subunit [Shouchella]|uniref:Exodeoxyribonuclease VII small subunit n=1 Tax=Shouchella hunanensis TaxID=766894 RepID=A0ABY7WAT7_9BACI|nr:MULTISPECIES: exodeoxyribonuclease VII small subunit [Shouchella]WDF05989.1 exodeoxyribonuclease VII small subunit [Shouchella hunanensis]